MQQADITIIGGGVSGMTTALTLQLLGFDTICYAEHLVNGKSPSDPRFSSLYPAASIIPHSVITDQMDKLFPPSRQVFDYLFQQNMSFMQLHRHYEVHEFSIEDPIYATHLNGYKRIEDTDDPAIPRYSQDIDLYGWSFNCQVAEWPDYMSQLYRWYRKAGGTIIQQRVTEEDIRELNSDIIVNCCGIWSTELFGEPEIPAVERGHTIFVKGALPVTRSDGTIISYNYTPDPQVYSDPQGNPTDVYFYPRSNGWIMGGSRQPGTIDTGYNFEGKDYTNSITHSGVTLPRPIMELNRKILDRTFNIYPDNLQRIIEPRIGYRFSGSSGKPGLRLDYTYKRDKMVIHNYGHGGAGVTLSWGCSLEVAKMVQQSGIDLPQKPGTFPSVILNHLQNILSNIARK